MNYVGQPITDQNSGSKFLIGWSAYSVAKRTRPTRPEFDSNFEHEGQREPTQPDFGPWTFPL